MALGHLVVIINLFAFNVAATKEQHVFETSTTDWIPLTRDEVMNRFRYRTLNNPDTVRKYWKPNQSVDQYTVDDNNVMQQIEPFKIQNGFKEVKSVISKMIKRGIPTKQCSDNMTNHIREQRKINFPSENNEILPDFTSTTNPIYITTPKAQYYEVKETIVDDVSHNIKKGKETSIGIYPTSKTQFSNVNSKQLLNDIYSKYKLTDPDTTNYEKSRTYENDRAMNIIRLFPNHQNLYRFNNQNHLLLDPVLAVFLSNYGHYLAGHYGVNSDYRNLYGYSASNNIHNNGPFGPYKVFSDTDSSN